MNKEYKSNLYEAHRNEQVIPLKFIYAFIEVKTNYLLYTSHFETIYDNF